MLLCPITLPHKRQVKQDKPTKLLRNNLHTKLILMLPHSFIIALHSQM